MLAAMATPLDARQEALLREDGPSRYRHWLERCPLLDRVRDRPELARVRAQVAKRADAVLDALYGDLEPETVVG